MTGHERALKDWLSNMDEELERFRSRLPDEVSRGLDFSVESLDVLEAWLLDRFPEPTRSDAAPSTFDSAARYIGETFRRTIGGHWWVDPEGKVMSGRYHVLEFRSSNSWICPLSSATTTTHRRKGTTLSDHWRVEVAWIAGKAKRSPLLDDKQLRKYLKITEEEKEFQYWLERMDDELQALFAGLPEQVRRQLDFSAESLDVLEAWLLDRYPDGAAARAESEILVLDGVARYVGETLCKLLSGQWWFDLERWSHNGLPQVTDFAGAVDTKPVCPLALAHAATETRGGEVFLDALHAKLSTT